MMTPLEAMMMAQEGTGPTRGGRFYAYDDATGKELMTGDTISGKATIGYGHNFQDKGIPADIAVMLLRVDLADAIDDVRHCCSVYDQLTKPRQMVMVSMAFNLGRDRLNQFVRFLGAVHRGDWEEAADEILDSKAAKQAPNRYGELAKMMRENTSLWV